MENKATEGSLPLHELKIGQCGTIVRVGGKGPAKRRMVNMGLVAGSEVKVERVAPLGDPIEIKIKGYHLSLRKEEAVQVYVEMIER